jgi:hypothetical protein
VSVYKLCLRWYSWHLAILVGWTRASAERQESERRLSSNDWTGEDAYEFWESIGQTWVLVIAEAVTIFVTAVILFRPDETAEDAAAGILRAVVAFAAAGACAMAVPIVVAWRRRHSSRPLTPRSSGWWILVFQVPAALLALSA